MLAPGDLLPGVIPFFGEYREMVASLDLDPSSYVVVATRQRAEDLEYVRILLQINYRSACLVGSSNKIRAIKEALRRLPFP